MKIDKIEDETSTFLVTGRKINLLQKKHIYCLELHLFCPLVTWW